MQKQARRIAAFIILALVISGILLFGIGFLSGNAVLISSGIYIQLFNIFLFLSQHHSEGGGEK